MTASVCCSTWNCSFCTFGLWGDFNDAPTNASVNSFRGEINICSGINDTAEGRGSATLSEKWALREHLGSLLTPKVYRAQVHDVGRESKGESIDLHEKYIAEGILEEARKGVEKEPCARCSRALITVLWMLVHKGESACVEVSKEIYTIAVKEWSDQNAKRLDVSLFDDLVNTLQKCFCIEKTQWTIALVSFLQDLPLIIYYYFTPSPHSVAFFHLMHYS